MEPLIKLYKRQSGPGTKHAGRRKKKFCKNGHLRILENLYKNRNCKKCMADAQRTRPPHAPERCAYAHAKGRCENPKDQAWKHYGGRGIQFLFASFKEFLKEIGPKPSSKHVLDRIQNNSDYRPGNVRWATRSESRRNTRSRVEVVLAPLLSEREIALPEGGAS